MRCAMSRSTKCSSCVAGFATVAFDDPALPSIELRPGSVVRLTAGMRTVWTVRETLRKVYLAG